MFFKKAVKRVQKSLFNKAITKRVSENKLNRNNYSELTIGCIVDLNKLETSLLHEQLASIFGISPNRVYVLPVSFLESEDDKILSLNQLDIHWKKGPSNSLIDQFLKTPYRVLINFYDCPHPVLYWLTMQTSATFRIGFGELPTVLNDLILNMDSYSTEDVIVELKKYATRLDILKNE